MDLRVMLTKRNTSACVPPEHQLEVIEGMRIVLALERIADALEAQAAQEHDTSCPICGTELKTTTVKINQDSTSENETFKALTITHCSCGFVKNVGVK